MLSMVSTASKPAFNRLSRSYPFASFATKPSKPSISCRLKSWSESGLLKTAAELSTSVPVSEIQSKPSASFTPSEPPTPTKQELDLMEYQELCRQLIAGVGKSRSTDIFKGKSVPYKRSLKSSKSKKENESAQGYINGQYNIQEESNEEPSSSALTAANSAPKKSHTSRKSIGPSQLGQEINGSRILSTTKSNREKKVGFNIKQSDLSPPEPTPKAAVSTTTTKKRRYLESDQQSSIVPELTVSMKNWQYQFEIATVNAANSFVSEFQYHITEIPSWNRHSPLGPLLLRYWQAPFPWDERVQAAALQYVAAASFSKNQIDPSHKEPVGVETSNPNRFSFKVLQKEAINMALSKCDLLLALPTGGGKTLCYVLPSLLEPGLTIVVSPLISLIQDQVTLLNVMGIGTVGINSQLPPKVITDIYNKLTSYKLSKTSSDEQKCPYKILFVTPERIGSNEKFMEILKTMYGNGLIQRIVIDEAHCISEWGHDFRRDYRRLRILRKMLPNVPLMAVTGTCTPLVSKDIAEQLLMDTSYYHLQTSFNRPNLWFQVVKKSATSPMVDMLNYILNNNLAQECGIVYAMTTSDAERLAAYFIDNGIQAGFYHGGMTATARKESQNAWTIGQFKVMCTTVAFGLGIDKSNVRFVIHSAMPSSLEAFYQQAGRAGRDGQPADCILFYNPKDRRILEHVIRLHHHAMKQKALLKKQQLENQKSKAAKAALAKAEDQLELDGGYDDLNIVDIVDVPEAHDGIIRLLKEDGSELLAGGSHPDVSEVPADIGPESAIDAFIRQMKTEKLDDVSSYCQEKKVCRRVHLMRHFGQQFTSSECKCNCDICAPSSKRIVAKLSKAALKLHEKLKLDMENRRQQMVDATAPSIHLLQSHQSLREAVEQQERSLLEEEQRILEEEDQYSKRLAPSSPLVRKMNRKKMSVLGDPSSYLVTANSGHNVLSSFIPHDGISKLSSEELQERLASKKSKSNRNSPTINTSSSDPDSSPIGSLMQKIALVTREKAERRTNKIKRPSLKASIPSNSTNMKIKLSRPQKEPATEETGEDPKDQSSTSAQETPADHDLRAVREACKQISDETGVPISRIISQKTMLNIAIRCPQDLKELQEIPGVGARRATKYAEYWLPLFKK